MQSNNIIYVGDRADIRNAPDVVALLDKQAANDPDAKIAVHTSPRCSRGILEWSVHITSPRGRRTLIAWQRRSFGPIQLK